MNKFRPSWKCDYVVSDLCGNIEILEIICNRLLPLRFSEGNIDRLFFLGNYIGSDSGSSKVLDTLINIKAEYNDRVVFLKGANEENLLNAIFGSSFQHNDFIQAGGISIAQSYKPGIESCSQTLLKQIIPSAHIEFLQSLEYFYIYDNYFFMHSGFDINKSISEVSISNFIFDQTFSRQIKDCIKANQTINFKDDYVFVSSFNFNSKKPFISQKSIMLGGAGPHKVFVLDLCTMSMGAINKGKERMFPYKFKYYE